MATSAILKRRTNIFKLIIASLLGGISSFILLMDINKIVIEFISIIIMALISFGYKSIKYTITNILYLYLVSVLLGGIIYLFNIKVNDSFLYYLVVIVISIEVVTLYIKEMGKIRNNYNNYYNVDIYFDEDVLSLVGFYDTGNNLYDPYKRRPIILVKKKYERNDKYILVPFNTASGDGLLKCIRVEKICIKGNTFKNVLVGFSDSMRFIDGVDVILHKDLLKGEENV